MAVAACNEPTAPRGPTGPPPAVSVVQVTDLGTIAGFPNVEGRDGGYSASFQGRSVWLFSDTFLPKPNVDGRTLISDSWAWTTDLHTFQERDDSSGDPAMFLAETSSERQYNQANLASGNRWALWLGSIVNDSARHRALVWYYEVHAAPGNFNFSSTGSSVAIWSDFDNAPVRDSTLLFTESEPGFGAASLIDGGYLYVYGCGTSSSIKPCPLGRVDPARVTQRSAWTFYAGHGTWSPSVTDALSVFSGNDIVSVAWNAYAGAYVAIYSYPLSNDVMLRTAPRPEGPWSAETTIFTALSGSVYDALAHAEFDADSTLYVSYTRNTGAFSSEVRLVSITLRRVPNE